MIPLLTGCYGYAPVAPGTPEPGADVRAVISDAEARRLGRADLLEPGNVLEGLLLPDSQTDSLSLSVRRTELRGVERFGSRRDTVAVAAAGVVQLEVQRIRHLRTAAVAAAAAAGMVGVFALLFEGAGQAGEDGEDPGPKLELRIPLHR